MNLSNNMYTWKLRINYNKVVISKGDFGEQTVFVDFESAFWVIKRHHSLITEDEFPLGPISSDSWQATTEKRTGWTTC